ncbi:hypothetical protein CA267_013205 [Alteromonas pelagimontana]|uniref:Histidine kinase/HSP90-like ATPase domain-containing protein n=1 Tax=Alteromonas pelagimontana TaxID=1858656 RepID=A0A6M4MGB9_9ALTE|nr:ATP-binding protein [Alteromonas pelagimontana]QJR81655.1 hypothetical protein CA267_013205 [Alteromonas pelagimontana]
MLLLFVGYCYRQQRLPLWLSLGLLLFEIGLFNAFIALNGAASNPFSIILLVPLVLGLMLLPPPLAVFILAISISGQILQLYLPHFDGHSSAMVGHSRSMIVGFVVTSFLITAVVFYFRFQLLQKTAAIHKLRERQLRDEQLLAIGTAAAQLTHDAATPIQTSRLIIEEAKEALSLALITELDEQFTRLENLLLNWRCVADDVREARLSAYCPKKLMQSLRYIVAVASPEYQVKWPEIAGNNASRVMADPTLVPALSSIVLNACEAKHLQSHSSVTISLVIADDHWLITVINPVSEVKQEHLAVLGSRIVASEKGTGIGAVVSNATIEKFGGKVTWAYDPDCVVTSIYLPAQKM